MGEAKRRDAWDRTAFACAVLANCHRDPKRKRSPYTINDFHPLARPAGGARTVPGTIHDLKVLLPHGPDGPSQRQAIVLRSRSDQELGGRGDAEGAGEGGSAGAPAGPLFAPPAESCLAARLPAERP
jgi:hypothetical protein